MSLMILQNIIKIYQTKNLHQAEDYWDESYPETVEEIKKSSKLCLPFVQNYLTNDHHPTLLNEGQNDLWS